MPCYTAEQLSKLDPARVPYHVAVVLDGNRRWAAKHNLSSGEGHKAGCERVTLLLDAAKEIGVKVITLYAFSTENWKRSSYEIEILMGLLCSYLKEQTPKMIREGIQFRTIGDLSKLRNDIQTLIQETKEVTQKGSSMQFVLALNYGARDEIRRAFHRMLEDYERGLLEKEEITESLISKYLDTCSLKDPDLFIRPSGEQRISNFLLWQISYTEIYTTPVLWPDFSSNDLLDAVLDFQRREIRTGS